jgi:hypothetical protein
LRKVVEEPAVEDRVEAAEGRQITILNICLIDLGVRSARCIEHETSPLDIVLPPFETDDARDPRKVRQLDCVATLERTELQDPSCMWEGCSKLLHTSRAVREIALGHVVPTAEDFAIDREPRHPRTETLERGGESLIRA